MAFKPRTIRRIILACLSFLVLLEIVVLTPSPTEDSLARPNSNLKSGIILDDEPTAIPDLPKSRVPEYGVNSFKYISIQNSIRQWKLDAEQAFMYDPEKLVHGRKIVAHLFDDEQKATIISGTEAKFFMNQRDLEIFGDVHARFPDGFEIWGDYMRYTPNDRRVQVPTTHAVRGVSNDTDEQKLEFSSMGFDYQMDSGLVFLPSKAHVSLVRSQELDAEGVPNKTLIDSDQCTMERSVQIAHFSMNPERPFEHRFVQITQPNLYTRARKADLNYGDLSNVLNYLVASDEVLIKESDPKSQELRYATGGLAEFDTKKDRVTLSQLPQVYQNEDTVTGELVIFHRNTGIIEIEKSNAYTSGQGRKETKKK